VLVKYPSLDRYNEAVQHPRTAFSDPSLKAGAVQVNGFDIPVALGGGFALTYTVTAQGRKFAVRCFHKATPGIQARYERISATLRTAAQPHFAGFEFQPDGILVDGKRYPIVKMDWANGETLGTYLESQHGDSAAIQRLRGSFLALERNLREQGIAHGDLQNGNVIVAPQLKLIDYDGMYVPGFPLGNGNEIGHRHFQHPKRAASQFGPTMDRFSFIVLDVSLRALAERSGLFKTFSNGENIIFSGSDFTDPSSSPAFAAVRSIPALARDCDNFARICTAPVDQVPSVDDFLAGQNIPPETIVIGTLAPTQTGKRPAARPEYIGAYDVVDATDFNAVHEYIGERIELIGQITDVSERRTRRGGRPYVFVNFGPWKGRIVKINIWSEGLTKLQQRPDKSWVGKHISVTGLVDPPYTNRKYGYTHLSITITESNQLRVIDRAEAARRIRATGMSDEGSAASTNQWILDAIRGSRDEGARQRSRGAGTGSRSSNQAVLDRIRAGSQSPASSRGAPISQYRLPPPKRTGVPWIWWALLAIGALVVLAKCNA
jgi:hypothetical protein